MSGFWDQGLSWPQQHCGDLTAAVLAVIRLTAVQHRRRGLVIAEQIEERGRFDVALAALLSDAELRRSAAEMLTGGDIRGYIQRCEDGSCLITVIHSKTDVEVSGAVVAGTFADMNALDATGLWAPTRE